MSKLAPIWAYIVVHKIVFIAILGAVINGMSKYPEFAKPSRYLHLLLDIVAPTVRADSTGVAATIPGTARMFSSVKQGSLKWPLLQRSLRPATAAVAATKAEVVPVASILIFFMLFSSNVSCTPKQKQIAIATVIGAGACVLTALGPEVINALPAVADAVNTGNTGKLDALGAQYGEGIVTCALQKVLTGLFAGLTAGASVDPHVVAKIRFTQSYLSSKNVTPVVK